MFAWLRRWWRGAGLPVCAECGHIEAAHQGYNGRLGCVDCACSGWRPWAG